MKARVINVTRIVIETYVLLSETEQAAYEQIEAGQAEPDYSVGVKVLSMQQDRAFDGPDAAERAHRYVQAGIGLEGGEG